MRSARAVVVAIVLALVAAPSVADACVFACQAAASLAARIAAQPCHHHQGHHPTVGDQHTARVHDRDAASGSPDPSTAAVDTAASIQFSRFQVKTTAVRPALSPPGAGAHLPLRI